MQIHAYKVAAQTILSAVLPFWILDQQESSTLLLYLLSCHWHSPWEMRNAPSIDRAETGEGIQIVKRFCDIISHGRKTLSIRTNWDL